MPNTEDDQNWMRRAIEISRCGEGAVEPNPMVGCVLVRDSEVIGEGWHEQFGGPHAEVNAIERATESIDGATAYVTLEPCSHFGKTPPCCQALIDAKVARVFVAVEDPNPKVAGQGIAALRAAGIGVEVGLLADEACDVLAPYLKRMQTGLPWIIAKWAMTIDGKIATASGDSQWISNEQSRGIVHELRGRVDAIMVGSGTALADDPMLNARPAGQRMATRVVVDSELQIGLGSKLVQTAGEYPTLIATIEACAGEKSKQLADAGCEVWRSPLEDRRERMLALLKELANRGCTNVMVEGGGGLLGLLHSLGQIDEIHGFIGPLVCGGAGAPTPVAGAGVELMKAAAKFRLVKTHAIENDVYAIWRASPRT